MPSSPPGSGGRWCPCRWRRRSPPCSAARRRGARRRGEDVLTVGVEDVAGGDGALTRRPRQVARRDLLLHQGDAVVAGDRPRLVAAELEAVVLRRVVAGRHLHAAGGLEVADGEVVHRRRRRDRCRDVEAGRRCSPRTRAACSGPRCASACRGYHHRIAVREVLRVQHVLEGEADLVARSPRRAAWGRSRGRRRP